jgi:hypothetical protein
MNWVFHYKKLPNNLWILRQKRNKPKIEIRSATGDAEDKAVKRAEKAKQKEFDCEQERKNKELE